MVLGASGWRIWVCRNPVRYDFHKWYSDHARSDNYQMVVPCSFQKEPCTVKWHMRFHTSWSKWCWCKNSIACKVIKLYANEFLHQHHLPYGLWSVKPLRPFNSVSRFIDKKFESKKPFVWFFLLQNSRFGNKYEFVLLQNLSLRGPPHIYILFQLFSHFIIYAYFFSYFRSDLPSYFPSSRLPSHFSNTYIPKVCEIFL